VQTALQPFGVGAVNPGKTIEWRQRHVRRCSSAPVNSGRSDIRLAARLLRIRRPSAA
jgi:hypothetical protein